MLEHLDELLVGTFAERIEVIPQRAREQDAILQEPYGAHKRDSKASERGLGCGRYLWYDGKSGAQSVQWDGGDVDATNEDFTR